MITNFYGAEFFAGEFFGHLDPVVVIDTHDGDLERDRRFKRQKDAKQRLRDQIRQAIDGESFLATALERVATPGPEALEARVEIGELVAQVELWKAVRESAAAYAARERAIDDDDEEVLILL